MKPGIAFIAFFTLLALTGMAQQLPVVVFQTSLGNISCEVDTVNAPLTANNFLKHIQKGTYDHAVFYRVVRQDNQPKNDVKIEVIQGGVFTEAQLEKIKPIRHESTKETGLKHLSGTLSMARMEPGSASTEFFICVGDQPSLDFGGKRNPDGQGFAAFGRVIDGMGTVRKIQNLKDKNQTLIEPVRVRLREVDGG